MSTRAKHTLLVALWAVLPKAAKVAFYNHHRAVIALRIASGHPFF